MRGQQNRLYQAEQGRAFPTICCLHLLRADVHSISTHTHVTDCAVPGTSITHAIDALPSLICYCFPSPIDALLP